MPYVPENSYILNFADLPSHLAHPETSFVRIIPVPYEATVTYERGTGKAPLAIIQASANLELWDEELSMQPCSRGIHTSTPLQLSSAGPEIAHKEVYEYVKGILATDKCYFFIGGEHSITSGIVRAFCEQYPSLSVLQLDAHADLRDTYQGSSYNHACVMRRVEEWTSFAQLGIRSISQEEAEHLKKNEIPHQTSFDILRSDQWKKVVDTKLSHMVYLTIDVDVLDPSMMPSVGTPEPGGLTWYKIMEILRYVARHKTIVGVDVVELSPIPGLVAPNFSLAKLIYKIIGYITSFQNDV